METNIVIDISPPIPYLALPHIKTEQCLTEINRAN